MRKLFCFLISGSFSLPRRVLGLPSPSPKHSVPSAVLRSLFSAKEPKVFVSLCNCHQNLGFKNPTGKEQTKQFSQRCRWLLIILIATVSLQVLIQKKSLLPFFFFFFPIINGETSGIHDFQEGDLERRKLGDSSRTLILKTGLDLIKRSFFKI